MLLTFNGLQGVCCSEERACYRSLGAAKRNPGKIGTAVVGSWVPLRCTQATILDCFIYLPNTYPRLKQLGSPNPLR